MSNHCFDTLYLFQVNIIEFVYCDFDIEMHFLYWIFPENAATWIVQFLVRVNIIRDTLFQEKYINLAEIFQKIFITLFLQTV